MYRKQMKFQRIICFLLLIASALIFIYSLGMLTDLYLALKSTMRNDKNYHDTKVEGSWIYYDMQPFNTEVTTISLILLGCAILLFVTNTHSRRKYYLANYAATGIMTVASVYYTIYSISGIAYFKNQYLTTVDFEQLKKYYEANKLNRYFIDQSNTFWFDAGFVVFGLIALLSVLLVANMIWKIILMREESRLIKEGMEGDAV